MKKHFPINPYLRALSISASVSGALVLAVKFTGQNGAITVLALQVLLYMMISSYRSREGKHRCILIEIESGKLIYIDIKSKKTPLVIFGVDAPEKDQKGHELTLKWLTDFLQSKYLSFENVENIDYYKGIQRPRFSENTSILYANGEDVALAGLKSGHLFISNRSKTPKIYQFAYLKEVINDPNQEFYNQPKTAIPLGQNIYGETEYRELKKFPHIIVAGTTGSGKSVEVNVMIISLMLKNTPDELRFVMIDPKMLELSIYDNSPHLSLPVITKMDEAKSTLEYLVNEMEYRYALLANAKVRDIKRYNKKINTNNINPLHDTEITENLLHPAKEKLSTLPLIICVIDEMADLIMQFGKEVEELIARIAQKARAAGIHLILATQRPDSEIVTGLIKANVPSRVALTVAGATNSRIILDEGGAEKLLGKGDMLIKTNNKVSRAQGYFIDENEILNYLKTIKGGYS